MAELLAASFAHALKTIPPPLSNLVTLVSTPTTSSSSSDNAPSTLKKRPNSRHQGRMETPTMTPEIEHDLKVLSQRSFLDPKRFYKRDKSGIPKTFQIGTVVADASEFYSARIARSQQKPHLVQELIDSANRKSFLKRRFKQIQARRVFTPKRSSKKKRRS